MRRERDDWRAPRHHVRRPSEATCAHRGAADASRERALWRAGSRGFHAEIRHAS
ncbi:hypothetical protein DB32_001843 [Sandaracinus amylolyticus]|uniref:Uncharacterized protein n=1 Tax=Sandaracinus amylolyticus TaxID=927083 RepID=A0A0F6SE73_9BACT|nr:hypothetical protein DB32_001843 [Sandaracinus amylolyticus]